MGASGFNLVSSLILKPFFRVSLITCGSSKKNSTIFHYDFFFHIIKVKTSEEADSWPGYLDLILQFLSLLSRNSCCFSPFKVDERRISSTLVYIMWLILKLIGSLTFSSRLIADFAVVSFCAPLLTALLHLHCSAAVWTTLGVLGRSADGQHAMVSLCLRPE